MSLRQILAQAVVALRHAGVSQPERDASILLAHLLGVPVWKIATEPDLRLSSDQKTIFDAMMARRNAREPVSQILGTRLFFGRSFMVTSDVLDPRPETEVLIAEVLRKNPQTVLDLGTGSGAIAITIALEKPQAKVIATDISAAALDVAQKNAQDLGARNIHFVQANWAEALRGQFDVIASNPPYLAQDEIVTLAPEVRLYEPHIALSPGGDGLDAYRNIISQSKDLLTPNGWLMFEIGWTQAPPIEVLLRSAGYGAIKIITDFDEKDRVILAQMS